MPFAQLSAQTSIHMSATQIRARLPFIQPGKAFDERSRKLRVFKRNEILVVRGWPDLMAWQKTAENPQWRYIRPKLTVIPPWTPGLQLSFYFALSDREIRWQKNRIAELCWHGLIPREIRRSVHYYPCRHWHLLQLAARCGKPGADLLQTNPALAYALSSGWVFHPVKRHLSSARNLLKAGRDQRDILNWLGFPPTQQVRRITSRVIHPALNITRLLCLRDAVKDNVTTKQLSHLPRLNAGVLRIVTDSTLLPWANMSLLFQVSQATQEDSYPETARLLLDCIEIGTKLGIRTSKLASRKSFDELHQLWRSLVTRRNLYELCKGDTSFPDPPIPGTPDIVPIDSLDEMIDEGNSMRNCVASPSYLTAIRGKRLYLYSVREPVRCTLSIAWVAESNQWSVDQLRSVCNGTAPLEVQRTVHDWISKHEDSTGSSENHAIHRLNIETDIDEPPPFADDAPF